MKNLKGYQAIEREAKKLGWPEYWATDLTQHDFGTLNAEDAPQKFGWGIRDTGTDLFRTESEVAVKWARACQTNRLEQRYYWFDGESLAEVRLEDLIQRLVDSVIQARYHVSVENDQPVAQIGQGSTEEEFDARPLHLEGEE